MGSNSKTTATALIAAAILVAAMPLSAENLAIQEADAARVERQAQRADLDRSGAYESAAPQHLSERRMQRHARRSGVDRLAEHDPASLQPISGHRPLRANFGVAAW